MSNSQDHSGSSDEDLEDDVALPNAQWQSQEHNSAKASTSVGDQVQSAATPMPMQKRRRVTRACDECRRKKIKCDGKQPCTHCTVYTYECTYDQPSNRRRNTAPQYVEALENRLSRAEAILRTVLPNVDLDDPNMDVGVLHRMHSVLKQETTTSKRLARPWVPLEKLQQIGDGEKDSMLESMVTNAGSLDLDDEGKWDFHGHSSGRVFLRKMREQFGDLMGQSEGQHAMPFLRDSSNSLSIESPRTAAESSTDPNLPNTHELPPKSSARTLCENALDDSCAILRVVHQPTFYAMFNRIYDTPREEFGDEEIRFLPQLYGVIALGTLFARAEQSQLQGNGYENAIDQGYNWFKVSRSMVDVTDCRDLTTLQTVLFMILFLQSSARLSTCYAYIGVVLRSSIRMGLHRSVSNAFNPIETELRKRIWWIVRKLDIYVGALLGLPQMLSDDDIDQEMPIEVDDEFISKEEILPMPPGRTSVFAAFNAHTNLVEILAKTVKYIYPIKGNEHMRGKNRHTYVVSHAKVREIEQDLQSWMDHLPMEFRPGEEAAPEFGRIRHLLRMAYAHIQMFLYRPFLHYVSQAVQAKSIDKRSYACAAACISVARNIIHLTTQMKKRGLLVGSYWFYMYTTFFSIISLVFFVLENPRSSMSEDILRDAYEGKDTLAGLAAKSMAADRCSMMLADMFEQLPAKLQGARKSVSQKKRSAPSQQPLAQHQMLPNAAEVNMKSFDDAKSPVYRSSMSPNQQQVAWKRSSIGQDSSPLRNQMVPTIDPSYRRASQETYGSSSANGAGMTTPNSPGNSVKLCSNSGVYGTQNTYVPELSSMMFPSADPFAYPNQPMITLENRQSIKQENAIEPHMYKLGTPGGTSPPFEHVEYSLMTPYMMQQQQPCLMQNMNPLMSMSGADPGAMHGNDSAWQQHQQQRSGATTGMNLDQLFGEDWGGWMNQGYRQ